MSIERVAVRYTVDVISDEHLTWFKNNGMRLAVKEGGENKRVHYHMYVEGNLKRWRNYFKRSIGGGNAIFSMKACGDDYIGYLRYLCKGENGSEPMVLFNDGYDTNKLHEESMEFCNAMKATGQLNKKRKLSTEVLEDQRPTNVLNECWEYVQEHCTGSSTQIGIGSVIMKWYYSQRMLLPNAECMSSMINTYMQWFNEISCVPISDDDMFRKLYPTLNG